MAPGICASALDGNSRANDWYQDGYGQEPGSIEAGKSVAELFSNAKAWTNKLTREGVTQVVNLGSGNPSPHGKSTHEAALRIMPES